MLVSPICTTKFNVFHLAPDPQLWANLDSGKQLTYLNLSDRPKQSGGIRSVQLDTSSELE